MTVVRAHTGERLMPVDVEDLPAAVREAVEEHRAAGLGAYELEIRHHGGETFEVIHRYSPDA